MFGRHCFAVVAIDILCVRTTTDRGERERTKKQHDSTMSRENERKKSIYKHTEPNERSGEKQREKRSEPY